MRITTTLLSSALFIASVLAQSAEVIVHYNTTYDSGTALVNQTICANQPLLKGFPTWGSIPVYAHHRAIGGIEIEPKDLAPTCGRCFKLSYGKNASYGVIVDSTSSREPAVSSDLAFWLTGLNKDSYPADGVKMEVKYVNQTYCGMPSMKIPDAISDRQVTVREIKGRAVGGKQTKKDLFAERIRRMKEIQEMLQEMQEMISDE